MNFPIKRSLLATIIIGLSVALSHCAPLKKRSDGKLASTEETIKPVENMKDWLDNQKETIALYKEYLRSLKVIATIIQEEKEKLRGGANLVEEASPPDPAIAARESATHRMTMESSRIRNIGMSVENRARAMSSNSEYAAARARLAREYTSIGNLPIENAISNNRGGLMNDRIGIDNMGARIDNVGKMLGNEAKHLENVLQQVEIFLKRQYSIAYTNYVKSYEVYSKQITLILKMTGRVNAQMGKALKNLRLYGSRSASCESRRLRLSRQHLRNANAELRSRNIYYSKVPQLFNKIAESEAGEECLHKTLLASNFLDTSELYSIGYNVKYFDDNKPTIQCPVMAEDSTEGMNAMDYPYVQLDEKSYAVTGYYQPVTYYQVFRLITDTENEIEITRPLEVDRPVCQKRNPGTASYLSQSRAIEDALGEEIDIDISSLNVIDAGYSAMTSSIPYRNKSYKKFLNRITTIFKTTEACTKTRKTPANVEIPAGTETHSSIPSGPLVAGAPASSDMTIFFDPDFPKMSASIRECMRQAEHYRYKAYTYIEATDAMLEVEKKALEMKPPRAPHPVQFKPVGANPNAGNN
jgi:hypothetical protein